MGGWVQVLIEWVDKWLGPCGGVQGGWVSLCRGSDGWRGAGQGAECGGATGRQCSSLFCRLWTCMGLAGRCLPRVPEVRTLRCWLCCVSLLPPGRWSALVKLQLTGHPPGAAVQALRLLGSGCGWLPAGQLRHPAGAGAGRSEWHHLQPASAAGAPASWRTHGPAATAGRTPACIFCILEHPGRPTQRTAAQHVMPCFSTLAAALLHRQHAAPAPAPAPGTCCAQPEPENTQLTCRLPGWAGPALVAD